MTFNQCTFINSKFCLINSYKHALLFTGGLVNFNSHQPEEAAHVHTIRGHNTTGRQHLKHALLRRSGTTLSLSFISALHALCLDAFVTSPNYPEITSRWCTKLSSKTCLFLLGVPLFLFLFSRGVCLYVYSGVNMFHASQTSTSSQRTRDQYVNRLRLFPPATPASRTGDKLERINGS